MSNLKVTNNKTKDGVKRRYKIRVDRELCTGIATCVALAPDVFELDDEMKAVTIDGDYVEDYSSKADFDTILTAAMSCPPQAIFIIDEETGEQVYPK